MAIGYEFLRERLGLSAFRLARPALVKPVTRLEPNDDHLAVPRHVAPGSDRPLDHLLFAFKHEGTNLQVAAEALQHIPAADLVAALREAPTGVFVRKACYLWEQLAGRQLQDLPEVGGPTVQVFDPDRYVTLTARRDPRWRVSFNGLGSLPQGRDVQATAAAGAPARSGDGGLPDRIAERGHDACPGSGAPVPHRAKLVARAAARRCRRDLRPARPGTGRRIDDRADGAVPAPAAGHRPVTAASVLSFGFVFIHPFMDGNGRLSRFLFHKALCSSGRLGHGALLPVSIAMKRNEADYLEALKSFSLPARRMWDVTWIQGDDFQFRFTGQASAYRYWDATACVAFGHHMAEQALEHDLRGETEYLADYDEVLHAVDARFDIRGSDLATLLRRCFDQQGRISNHSRRQFQLTVPAEAFDFIEEQVGRVLAARRTAAAA